MMEKDKLKEALKEPLEKLKKMVNEDLRKPCNKDLAINFGRNGLRVTKEDLPMNEEELDEVKIKLGESYEDIILFLKDYIDMKEENYPLLALWIIGTYFHKSFSTFPYLFVNAMRGSGKTRLLGIIKALSWNGELLTSVREASLFRSAGQNTICIDEFEGIMKKENAGLREILNASYKKGMTIKRMKKVKSADGEDYAVQEFEPYTPIVMANIWGMEEVLGDRCIKIMLEKSDRKELIFKMEDFYDNPKIDAIKKKLTQCSLCSVVSSQRMNKKWNLFIGDIYTNTTLTTQSTYITPINKENDKIFSVVKCRVEALIYEKELDFFNKIKKNDIGGRYLELFFPLYIIANTFNQIVLNKILKITSKMYEESKTEERTESRDVMVYQFVAMQDDNLDYIDMVSLLNQFKQYVHDDEHDFQWVNSKWLGRSLKRLNLIIDKRRMAMGMQITLDVKKAIKQVEMFK